MVLKLAGIQAPDQVRWHQFAVQAGVGDEVRKLMNWEFPRAGAALGHTGLILGTHAVRLSAKDRFPGAEHPAQKRKIVSAKRGTTQDKTLQAGKAPVVIDVDIWFDEPLAQIHGLELTGR